MLRALPLALVVFALACQDSAATGTTQPCEAPPAKADGPSTPGFTQPIVDAARGSTVERVKVRVDEAGAIVKQSVYHGDRSAIPEPVLALVDKTFPGGQPKRYETEHYADLGQVYEVEVDTADGKMCEVAAGAAGDLVYTECRIDPTELPAPVSARVSATFPDGKILEAEQKSGPKVDEFTIEVEVGGRQFYLRVAPDGTLLAKLVRVPAILELPIE